MIRDFIKQFTNKEITHIQKIKRSYYLVENNLLKLKEEFDIEPFSIGLFLGFEHNKRFFPSLALLELISTISDRKVYVNDQAEWLFICKKDIFGKSITKSNVESGIVLIQNRYDENLGFGKVSAPFRFKEKVVIKRILDKGEYLRMEN